MNAEIYENETILERIERVTGIRDACADRFRGIKRAKRLFVYSGPDFCEPSFVTTPAERKQ